MTKQEADAIDALRKSLASYHLEVREHIVESEAWRARVAEMHRDMYGEPGQKGQHPGLMGEVAGLRRSKRFAALIFGGIWTVTTLTLSALLALIGVR